MEVKVQLTEKEKENIYSGLVAEGLDNLYDSLNHLKNSKQKKKMTTILDSLVKDIENLEGAYKDNT